MTTVHTCADFADQARADAVILSRNPGAYLAGAFVGGACVAFASVLALAVSAAVPLSFRPVASGLCFGLGLILVSFGGGNLFTGQALIQALGLAGRRVNPGQAAGVLATTWLGNLFGALAVAALFSHCGGPVFATPDLLQAVVARKENAPVVTLLCRGLLCNWLICLAVWTSARIRAESAQIVVMAWCLLAFVACGFENAVANMATLAVALFAPQPAGSLAGVGYNLACASAGNLIGGALCVALPYLVAGRADHAPIRTAGIASLARHGEALV